MIFATSISPCRHSSKMENPTCSANKCRQTPETELLACAILLWPRQLSSDLDITSASRTFTSHVARFGCHEKLLMNLSQNGNSWSGIQSQESLVQNRAIQWWILCKTPKPHFTWKAKLSCLKYLQWLLSLAVGVWRLRCWSLYTHSQC